MSLNLGAWALIALAGFALLVLGVLVGRSHLHLDPFNRRLRRRARRPPRTGSPPAAKPDSSAVPPAQPLAAVVVNPTKFFDVEGLREQITQVCRQHGWADPLWLETTAKQPGAAQARAAVEQGAQLVCSLGGDGTVRAVASALVGTTTPLGLLPGGTGNLLARNLDLPVDTIERALLVALAGKDRAIDIGRVSIDRSGEDHRPQEDIFLVMAGIGFDARLMADAPERLKAQVGPAAYIVAGVRNMKGPQFKVRLTVDDGPEVPRRTRTVLIGNCGRLFGGVALMPEARVDDGLLDSVVISPNGLVGWTAVAARVLSRRRHGHPVVDHHTGRRIGLRADRPEQVQLDGDPMGAARSVTAWVDARALVVRVPAREPVEAAPVSREQQLEAAEQPALSTAAPAPEPAPAAEPMDAGENSGPAARDLEVPEEHGAPAAGSEPKGTGKNP